MHDVVVAGAGPNGLMLACELALHGVRPVVLERLTAPSTEPRANGLVGQVVRMLDRRGLYAPMAGTDEPPRPADRFMFAAFPLELDRLADNPVHLLLVPQRRIEAVLADRARDLGVEVRRGRAVTGFTQGPDSVLVEAGDERLEARFLVGADGGRSTVRKLAGIGFPGITTDETISRSGNVTVPPEFRDPVGGGLDVPGYGVIPPFLYHRTERGVLTFADLPGRGQLLSVLDRVPSDEPFTLDELRAAASRVLGVPLEFGPPEGDGPHLLRRYAGGNTRLAERYRDGRVLLVGDAAHVHSAIGGPGLNLGLQDAVNLGWKLAAEIRGEAPDGLLDTYEAERRPAGERVTMHTQAQSVLLGPGSGVTALRQLFGELLAAPSTLQHVADLVAGSDLTYGRWVPDLTVAGTRLAELLRTGRPLLVDPGGLAGPAGPWRDRVDVVHDPAAPAMLIRPDGVVAWEAADGTALPDALGRWFGVRSRSLRAA